jgi:hypothetical protein
MMMMIMIIIIIIIIMYCNTALNKSHWSIFQPTFIRARGDLDHPGPHCQFTSLAGLKNPLPDSEADKSCALLL